jgi:transposase
MDLRERVIGAWKNGDGMWEEIAKRYGVGVATVDRLVTRYRATRSVAPTVQKSGCDLLLDAPALPARGEARRRRSRRPCCDSAR